MMLQKCVCTHVREMFPIDSQPLLVLPSTIGVRYYSCYSDGSISAENFGYHLVDSPAKFEHPFLHLSEVLFFFIVTS